MENTNNGGYGREGYPSEGSNQDQNLNASGSSSENTTEQYAATNSDFAERESETYDAELISSDELEDDDLEGDELEDEDDDSDDFENDDETADETDSDDFRTDAL